ncbi:hybrid sensor histidine kinase/response regulator [Cytophagales bacterium WSM2-2]|nr:hybrid sensor histidine kinase/response regulator [Cytophagales bacterium WSM2-2]
MENHELRILMLEDREEDVELISRMLKKDAISYVNSVVDTKEQFEEALRLFKPEVILSDHALPQFNSFEALLMIKQKGLKIPFILVTGTVSEEFAVSCLKQGADDYILKSNLVRLPSAIRNALRKRNVEMRREKAESDLRSQNEELVKVNHELDSFVYSVSHNLRAPLMSVLGLIHLAKAEDNQHSSHFNHYFELMQTSIHKLDETLKEILDYSKNARKEIHFGQVNVKQLIEDAVESLKYLKGFDHIELKINVKDNVPLYSDATRLKVIVSNLLSNAIKYADLAKSNPFIEVEVIITSEKLNLRFTDNGLGIRPELKSKIFNMFFRATEKSDGAGLGLYIVKEASKKLSGYIEVDSEPGQGSTFQLVFPNHVNQRETVMASGLAQ